MNELDPRIDAALKTYPLAEPPSGFTRRVMSAIYPQQLSFRFEFLDFVLPFFFALFATALLAAAGWSILLVDTRLLQRVEKFIEAAVKLVPDLSYMWLYLFVSMGIALLLFTLLGMAGGYFINQLSKAMNH